MTFKSFGHMIGACSLMALVAAGAVEAKEFRYATSGDLLGMDPHLNNEGPTNAMKNNIYEGLVQRDAQLRVHPSLATSWETTDPTTWRFTLREGVKFHNGNPLTAEDVAFSFERVNQPDSGMASYVATVAEVRAIDDLTVELVTKAPDPILLQNLPLFFVMDKEWTEENNTVNVIAGPDSTTYANLNANGTGPFRLTERVIDTRTVIERNEDWWGWGDETIAITNITKATFQPIGNNATRVSALLSGEMDMVYPVPLQDIPRVNENEGTQVLEGAEARVVFLGFDQFRDELLDMPGTGDNPFKDRRVRLAFYQAINIDAIQQRIMRGAATPVALPIAPTINGYDASLDERFPYDPEAAKALLAEAGYPDGFPVTLDCPNDRYVNDEAICTAVVGMLRQIGIDITLNAQTKSLHFAKIGRNEGYNTSFFMLGWTPGTYDAHNPLAALMTFDPDAGLGTWNSGRYNNPRVTELTQMIAKEMDPAARAEMISEAYGIHREDVAMIPLHQQALAWGVVDSVVDTELTQQPPSNDPNLRWIVLR